MATDSTNPSGEPPRQSSRRRVMITGLNPIRKPGSGVDESTAGSTAPMVPTLPFRIGHGYDIHRLEPAKDGKKLIVAGVTISDEISPIAHSDGDVVYHAIVDALLGAMGLGDIGELYGDSSPEWKDANSKVFVDDVYDKVRQSGYRLSNLDVSLLLERPKVMPHKPAMLANLRKLFGPSAAVNIKAGTNEKCDAVGRGEAIVAHAVVLLMASH